VLLDALDGVGDHPRPAAGERLLASEQREVDAHEDELCAADRSGPPADLRGGALGAQEVVKGYEATTFRHCCSAGQEVAADFLTSTLEHSDLTSLNTGT
jgi:hypothetical protein